jgi:hypothetical protein
MSDVTTPVPVDRARLRGSGASTRHARRAALLLLAGLQSLGGAYLAPQPPERHRDEHDERQGD